VAGTLYLFLLVTRYQWEKVTQKKDSPALLVTPGAKFKPGSNSRDPLRGHALRHESADCPGAAALLGGSQGPQKRRGANSLAALALRPQMFQIGAL